MRARPTKYNKRVTIQQRTKDQNEVGGWGNVWSDLYSSWASVTQVSGAKRFEYGQHNLSEVYQVEMRKRDTNVDADCQVIYGGNAFQIVSITIDDYMVKMDIAR
jgi:SPP1 family predicted phage head-tail adaptor